MDKDLIVNFSSQALHAYVKMKNSDGQACTVAEFDAWISGFMSGLSGTMPAVDVDGVEKMKADLDDVYSRIMSSEIVVALGFNGEAKTQVSVAEVA